jgi:hypothetical protein
LLGCQGAEQVLLARLDEHMASGPLLLVVDDAYAVDAATLGFLEQAASLAGDLPVKLHCSLPVGPSLERAS